MAIAPHDQQPGALLDRCLLQRLCDRAVLCLNRYSLRVNAALAKDCGELITDVVFFQRFFIQNGNDRNRGCVLQKWLCIGYRAGG